MPRIHILPALEYQRLPAGTGQRERGKHPCGTKANDHGPELCAPGRQRQCRLCCRCYPCHVLIAPQTSQHGLFCALYLYIQYINELNRRPLIATGIDSLTHNYHLKHSLRW